jgi:hypothetical protein
MTVAWSNVYADGTLRATFDANVTVYDHARMVAEPVLPGHERFSQRGAVDTMATASRPGPSSTRDHSDHVLSVMKMVAGRAEPGGPGIIVQWSSVTNKRYRLERISDLKAGYFTNLKTNIPAVPPVNVETDRTTSGRGPWLYRIELER